MNKYGCYPTQNSEIMQKVQLNARKYKKFTLPSGKIINIQGYEHYAISELLKLYSEDDIKTNRSEIPRIEYKSHDKTKYYFPDIYLPKENKIIEVKSEWTYSKDLVINTLKLEATKAAGYTYEIWIYSPKGDRVNTII